MPLQHENVEQYKPNYSIMNIVATARNPVQGYQVASDRLQVDKSPSGFLGQGGSGKLHLGAPKMPDSGWHRTCVCGIRLIVAEWDMQAGVCACGRRLLYKRARAGPSQSLDVPLVLRVPRPMPDGYG